VNLKGCGQKGPWSSVEVPSQHMQGENEEKLDYLYLGSDWSLVPLEYKAGEPTTWLVSVSDLLKRTD
jgi:hypothetical protein